MNIYVGNLPYKTDSDTLRELFESYGSVNSAEVIVDRRSGRSRGYGFVEMSNDDEAKQAVEALNGSEHGGRNLRVDFSRPREEGQPRQPRSRQGQRNQSGQRGKPAQQQAKRSEQKSGGVLGFIKKIFSS